MCSSDLTLASPLLMGGYFPGRPTEPESGPAKTQEAQVGMHFSLHGLDKEQAGQPVNKSTEGKGAGGDRSPSRTRSTSLEG